MKAMLRTCHTENIPKNENIKGEGTNEQECRFGLMQDHIFVLIKYNIIPHIMNWIPQNTIK